MKRLSIAVILIIATGIFLSACDDKKDPETAQAPVFSVTPVDIAYNPSDSSFGDISFQAPVILPFGALISDNQYSTAISYITVPGAPVRAVTEGVVDTVIENPIYPNEYEVRVVCLPGSDYIVVYDKILNMVISDADHLMPGDTIGEAGNFSDFAEETSLRVFTGEGSNVRYYCPLNYGDSAFVARHKALLAEYNRRGFQPQYDSLCLRNFLTP
jgi:hypothetical protein